MGLIHPITEESMALQCSQGNALCFTNTSWLSFGTLPTSFCFSSTSGLTALPWQERIACRKHPAPSAPAVCLSLSSFQWLLVQVWIPDILPACIGGFPITSTQNSGDLFVQFPRCPCVCVFTQHGAGTRFQLLETSPETTACEGVLLEAEIWFGRRRCCLASAQGSPTLSNLRIRSNTCQSAKCAKC